MSWEANSVQQLVSFASLAKRAASVAGVRTAGGLRQEDAESLAPHLTLAVAAAWRYHDWPDTRTVEKRTLDDTDPETPALVTVGGPGRAIGTLDAVYCDDPRTCLHPRKLPVFRSAVGYYLPGFAPGAEVFVVWVPPPPEFTHEPWVEGQAYGTHDVVWGDPGDGGDGHCYRWNHTGTVPGDTLPTAEDSSGWTQQSVPAWMADAVIYSAAGAIRREEGQEGKASGYEREANARLEEAVLRQYSGEGQGNHRWGG